MNVCILDAAGQVLVHRNVKSTPEAFLEIVAPYRDALVVAAECMFTLYWPLSPPPCTRVHGMGCPSPELVTTDARTRRRSS